MAGDCGEERKTSRMDAEQDCSGVEGVACAGQQSAAMYAKGRAHQGSMGLDKNPSSLRKNIALMVELLVVEEKGVIFTMKDV